MDALLVGGFFGFRLVLWQGVGLCLFECGLVGFCDRLRSAANVGRHAHYAAAVWMVDGAVDGAKIVGSTTFHVFVGLLLGGVFGLVHGHVVKGLGVWRVFHLVDLVAHPLVGLVVSELCLRSLIFAQVCWSFILWEV